MLCRSEVISHFFLCDDDGGVSWGRVGGWEEEGVRVGGRGCEHILYIHVNGLATLYKVFRHPPYGHLIKLRVWRAPLPAGPGFELQSSVPEVDESTIQLPSLLLVVGAVSLPFEV